MNDQNRLRLREALGVTVAFLSLLFYSLTVFPNYQVTFQFWVLLAAFGTLITLKEPRWVRLGGLLFLISLLNFWSEIRNLWPLASVTGALIIWRLLGQSSVQQVKYSFRSLSFRSALAALGLALVSFGILMIWFYWRQPSREEIPFSMPNQVPGLLMIGILFHAVGNAFAEEYLFRKVALDAFHGVGPKRFLLANLMQALAFGCLHYNGFPGGVSGFVLTMTYGFILGMIRHHTGRLALPWMTHAFTNILMALLIWYLDRP